MGGGLQISPEPSCTSEDWAELFQKQERNNRASGKRGSTTEQPASEGERNWMLFLEIS